MYDHRTNMLTIIDYGMYQKLLNKGKKLATSKDQPNGTPIYFGRNSMNFMLQTATAQSEKSEETITTTNDDTESCMKVLLEMFVPKIAKNYHAIFKILNEIS